MPAPNSALSPHSYTFCHTVRQPSLILDAKPVLAIIYVTFQGFPPSCELLQATHLGNIAFSAKTVRILSINGLCSSSVFDVATRILFFQISTEGWHYRVLISVRWKHRKAVEDTLYNRENSAFSERRFETIISKRLQRFDESTKVSQCSDKCTL